MTDNEVLINKIANIERNLKRLKDKQGISVSDFSQNQDAQDIVILNLQMAIQGCIDIASHIISSNSWELPGSLAGLFDILYQEKVIDNKICNIMRSMVGLRNLIVHEYSALNIDKIHDIFTNRLSDFNTFLKAIIVFARL